MPAARGQSDAENTVLSAVSVVLGTLSAVLMRTKTPIKDQSLQSARVLFRS
jgi:hypothetical protein